MDLNTLTIEQAKKGLRKKKFTATELTQVCLKRIKETEPKINALVTQTAEFALLQAKKADKQIANGEDAPLLGIPLVIKDNFSTKGIRTTASSKVLDNYIPPFNATVVQKLFDAGAIMLGKANMDAWAHGSSGENSDFVPTKNPWNTEYVPGGSGSGSAAAVAANMCLAGTGTDTGGSIRLPASFCNIVGLKPTYGRVSRYGIVAMASSIDSIGHITKTVEDSALMLNVTAGKDIKDATTSEVSVLDYTKNLKKGLKGLRIGIDPDFFSRHIESETANLLKNAYNLIKNNLEGEIITDISLPHSQYGNACYYIIQPSEVSSNLARYDGIRYGNGRDKFGEEAKRRIMLGTYTLSAGYYDAYYKKALQVKTLIIKDFQEVFKKVDAIITPVSPTPPWRLGEKINDPLKMYLSDIFTVTANLAGIPGLSIPIGFTKNGLPVGMQILGPHFSEDKLFQIGYAYEQATDWHKQKPTL